MLYTEKQQAKIQELKSKGLSSRKIADKLGISKSGVNEYLGKLGYEGHSPKPKKGSFVPKEGAKILLFDFETAADVSLTFGRWKQNISQSAIVKQGHFILCSSWKFRGEKEIHSVHLTPEEIALGDDSKIVAVMWDLYAQSNAVVAHNSQGFDHKVLQGRCAYHGYPALPSVKVLDTLVQCKKAFRLPSNKLGDVASYFGLETKLDTGGMSLWKDVQSGSKEAMERMLDYCKQDVNVLDQVYEKVKAFGNMGSTFNAGLYYDDDKMHCKTCGSTDLEDTGRTIDTSLSRFTELRCADCGAVHRVRTSITTKEDRSKLLM